jgi:hypothetical protein
MALAQSHYRFGIDSGTESTHGWHAAENTAPTAGDLGLDTTFLLRFNVQASGGVAHGNIDLQFQYQLNGGGWVNITTSSSVVRAVAATALTNGGNCTKRLSGTGTFESTGAGQTEDGLSGGNANDIAANGCSETECGLQILSADVANNDVIEFRLTSPDASLTYTVTPSYTVVVAQSSRATVTWAELEAPTAPRRALVTWGETEAPNGPRRALATWGEMEAPTAPRRALVSWAEAEGPTAPRRALASWAELESPDAPTTDRRSTVAWGELEAPTAPRRALVAWSEAEAPDGPRRAVASWGELVAPSGPRRAVVSWAEAEAPAFERRALVSGAELQLPSVAGEPAARSLDVRQIGVCDCAAHMLGVLQLGPR